MFAYIECPISDLPTEEDLLNLFSEDNSLPNAEKREQFLCYLRLMCLAFLKCELTGSPSLLIESQIKCAIVNTSDSKALDAELSSNILPIIRAVEYESGSFFEDPTALYKMQQCYDGLKSLLVEIQNKTPECVEIFDSRFKESIALKITKDLFSKDLHTFFNAFIYTFTEFCDTLSSDDYFKKTAWENRQNHLKENSLTEKICSYLKPVLSKYDLEIKHENWCGDGRCDIIIKKSNKIIPIEAKNSDHDKLWSAIKDQLVDKYMCTNHHYGIYLVYWYGTDRLTKSSNVNSPIGTHHELKANLANYSIPESHKERVKVLCINCD